MPPRGTSLEVPQLGMRKRYRVLIFAALVAALVVPVGFALELPISTRHASAMAVTSTLPAVPDALKLFAVGTILIGLAAFVRKTV